MSQSGSHDRLPDDLQEVADMLRSQRPSLQPLELDRIKLRAMSGARGSTGSTPSKQKGYLMRSRLVTFLTVGALALSGGTAAAGLFDFGGGYAGWFDNNGDSASHHQYRPPCPVAENFGSDHKCHKDNDHHHRWQFVHHHWDWQGDGHGGFKWGFGDGWVAQ
jgi:hypothetical protein